nr:glycosyltransferase [Brevundimonas naejangsanensis]
MRSTSVLHIITGLNDGGAEAVLYRLCAHDVRDRHHVISLTGAGKYGPLLLALGVRVTYLNMPRRRVTAQGLWRLWCLVRKLEADVVQTWMYHADLLGGVAAWLAGHRNIIWGIRHTTLIPGESPRSTIAVAQACAWVSRIVPRRILCCAEGAIKVHTALGYDADRMVFVPNGYDLTDFRPDTPSGSSVRSELALGSGPIIGFVARYDPQKDHNNLLQALGLLKAVDLRPTCLLVGTGLDPDNAALVERIAQLGLSDQVHLLGRRSDIPSVMNALDVHVMSSSFGEAFPNVLAEAMACGTPCVSTDVGDAASIVGDTGWIVPPRDPQALADAIALALKARYEPDWLKRKTSARNHIETRFSIAQMVDRYRDVWFGPVSPSLETRK